MYSAGLIYVPLKVGIILRAKSSNLSNIGWESLCSFARRKMENRSANIETMNASFFCVATVSGVGRRVVTRNGTNLLG